VLVLPRIYILLVMKTDTNYKFKLTSKQSVFCIMYVVWKACFGS